MDATKSRWFVEHAEGMFQPELLRELRSYLEKVEGERLQKVSTEREKKAVSRGESPDALRFDGRWYEVWQNPSQKLLERVRPYTWVVFPVQVRYVRSELHKVPWHQDAAFQRLLGPRGHKRIITCFIPIDDDPSRRTTIQYIQEETPELPHAEVDGFGAGLDNINPPKPVHYLLKLGDCFMFGDLIVHRTFVPKECVVERRSLEFRLVRKDDALDDKDYFDIERGLFVRKDGSTREQL